MYLRYLALLLFVSFEGYSQQTGILMGNYPTGGSLGSASTTVDVETLMNIQQTTTGQTITIPSPTNPASSRNITITNIGTVPVILSPGGMITPNTGIVIRWTGTAYAIIGAGVVTSNEDANKVYSGPPSGGVGTPSFRYLVSDDIPTISNSKVSGLSSVATTNDYNDLFNKPTIPSAQVNSDWASVSGVSQILNKPTIPSTTTQISEGTNLYYTDTRARASNSAGTGISYNSSTGVITNSSPDQTVSLTSGTGISTSGTYPSFTVTNTAPDQTVTLTAGRGIAITGTYPNFTVSLVTPTISIVTRSVNSNFTISSTKEATVTYTVTCSVTNPLLVGTSTATAFLEYSINGGSSWLLPSQTGNSSGVGVTVTLQLTNGQTGTLVGVIPANALTRIRTTTAGTASVTYVTGQETTY